MIGKRVHIYGQMKHRNCKLYVYFYVCQVENQSTSLLQMTLAYVANSKNKAKLFFDIVTGKINSEDTNGIKEKS